MDKNQGKLSLKHTHDLLDLLEELEQIPHPMAEALYAKFEDFVAREGFDESELANLRDNLKAGYTLVIDPATGTMTKETH
jgi:hypothetical protein